MKYTYGKERISIAPMVDVTDKHFRRMCRFLTSKTLLYTEMIAAPAIVNGDHEKLLEFWDLERPLAVQIAGSDEDEICKATSILEKYGFDEINLNVGCPSPKVSEYSMGASLMAYPDKVASIAGSMLKISTRPVSIKHRLGIDGKGVIPTSNIRADGSYDGLKEFIKDVSRSGVKKFIIHSRIAVLKGLDPAKNRSIPPLEHDKVHRIKREFPELHIGINGGIRSLDEISHHLEAVDSVMIGRVAYENPMMLCFLDDLIDGKNITQSTDDDKPTRRELIEYMMRYARELETKGERSLPVLKHMYGIFHGKKGSRIWKQMITPPYDETEASLVMKKALAAMDDGLLDERPSPYDFMEYKKD